jgi:hypothetical protein
MIVDLVVAGQQDLWVEVVQGRGWLKKVLEMTSGWSVVS